MIIMTKRYFSLFRYKNLWKLESLIRKRYIFTWFHMLKFQKCVCLNIHDRYRHEVSWGCSFIVLNLFIVLWFNYHPKAIILVVWIWNISKEAWGTNIQVSAYIKMEIYYIVITFDNVLRHWMLLCYCYNQKKIL